MYNQLFDIELQERMTYYFTHTLSTNGRIKAYEKNCIIDPEDADHVHVVLDGELNQILYSESGDEVILCRLQRGNIFGEMDFFDGDRTCIITKAVTPCAISIIPRDIVEMELAKDPDVYKHFIHSIVRKYRILMLEFADNHFNDSLGKVAHLMVRLSYSTAEAIHDGQGAVPLNIYFTHEELANRLNANRSTVTSCIKRFKNEHLIDVDGKKITLLDMEGLKKYCNKYLPE